MMEVISKEEERRRRGVKRHVYIREEDGMSEETRIHKGGGRYELMYRLRRSTSGG